MFSVELRIGLLAAPLLLAPGLFWFAVNCAVEHFQWIVLIPAVLVGLGLWILLFILRTWLRCVVVLRHGQVAFGEILELRQLPHQYAQRCSRESMGHNG